MSVAEPPPERGRPRGRRGPARLLAPAALVAVVVVVVIVVSSTTGSSRSSDGSLPLRVSSPASRPATRSGARPSRTSATRRKVVITEAPGPNLNGLSTTATSPSVSGTSTTVAGTYTIAAGDTFAAVSAKTGVPIATIEQLNPRVSSSALTIGQVIKLR